MLRRSTRALQEIRAKAKRPSETERGDAEKAQRRLTECTKLLSTQAPTAAAQVELSDIPERYS